MGNVRKVHAYLHQPLPFLQPSPSCLPLHSWYHCLVPAHQTGNLSGPSFGPFSFFLLRLKRKSLTDQYVHKELIKGVWKSPKILLIYNQVNCKNLLVCPELQISVWVNWVFTESDYPQLRTCKFNCVFLFFTPHFLWLQIMSTMFFVLKVDIRNLTAYIYSLTLFAFLELQSIKLTSGFYYTSEANLVPYSQFHTEFSRHVPVCSESSKSKIIWQIIEHRNNVTYI